MRFRFFKRAKGGRISKRNQPHPDSVLIQLSEGEVHCLENECSWFKVGGDDKERWLALSEHQRKCHVRT